MQNSIVVAVCLLLIGAVSCHPGSTRIVNGNNSKVEDFPYVVSLRSASGSHSCGASIIDPLWILTAAHCVNGRAANTISFQYGATNISVNGNSIAYAEKTIIHEDYAPARSYANDIALVKLISPLTLNATVNKVKLPAQGQKQVADSEAILVGWGLNRTGGSVQETLQEVLLKVYSDSECNSRHVGRTSVNNICAGVDEGGKGQCSGDSGGPLTQDGVIIGLVSWSVKPCTVAGYPGVFTKVSSYINWIATNMV